MIRNILLAAAAVLALAADAHATPVLTFGQVGAGDTVTATANGAGTSTTLSATDVPISITQILGGSPVAADFNLSAVSIGTATPLGSGAYEAFGGTFKITSGAGGTGIDYLSGSFSDLVLGVGTSAVLSAGSPPDFVSFISGVIPASLLGDPTAISLSFADASPAISIKGTTLASFTSTVSGTFSATPIPEPAPVAALGIGLLALGLVTRKSGRRYAG